MLQYLNMHDYTVNQPIWVFFLGGCFVFVFVFGFGFCFFSFLKMHNLLRKKKIAKRK